MSYLRTNYRLTGGQLDIDAIGGGIPAASIFGGAGTLDRHGGLIMGSFASEVDTYFDQSAFGAMSDWYGSVFATMLDSGHRIMPMGAQVRLLITSVTNQLLLTGSVAGDSRFRVYIGNSGSLPTSTSSLGLVWWGLIISTP